MNIRKVQFRCYHLQFYRIDGSRLESCGFLSIFTYKDDGLFQVMVGYVKRLKSALHGYKIGPAVARNRRKAIVKIRRNPQIHDPAD